MGLLIGWRHYDIMWGFPNVMWDFPKWGLPSLFSQKGYYWNCNHRSLSKCTEQSKDRIGLISAIVTKAVKWLDKEGVPKFNVRATSPLPYPIRWNFYVCSKYLAKSNSAPNFSIVSIWIMQLCKYVFPIGLPLYVPKNGVLGSFKGEDVKILCSDLQKALPCVNTRQLMYRMSKSVQRPEL